MSGDRLSLSTILTDDPYLSSSSTRSLCSAIVAMWRGNSPNWN
jgi:hypothetical protein